ncbi:trm112p-like family protein [Brucella melitensis bv. 1 str. 16M]|nr:trm112p-like family protein [Brucella melitensis bv. 1 str. 16M]
MDDKVETGNIDVRLLELLVCPLTKGPLEYDAERSELVSRKARLGLSGAWRHSHYAAFRGAQPDRVSFARGEWRKWPGNGAEMAKLPGGFHGYIISAQAIIFFISFMPAHCCLPRGQAL